MRKEVLMYKIRKGIPCDKSQIEESRIKSLQKIC